LATAHEGRYDHAMTEVRNPRDVVYTRAQKGHSLTLWIILSVFLVIPVIGLIYYSVSPNHYWHA
jgi:hypothetical protein